MNYKQSTFAFLLVGMLAIGSPAVAAQHQGEYHEQRPEAEAKTQAQADVEAKTSSQGIMNALVRIQQQLTDIQNRQDRLEARVDAQANGQEQATGEVNANGHRGPPEQTPPAHAKANSNSNNGAEVNHSVEVEKGTKTISHKVEKNGQTMVSFVKEIFVGAEAEAEAENENETEEEKDEERNQTENESESENQSEQEDSVEAQTESETSAETGNDSVEVESEISAGADLN